MFRLGSAVSRGWSAQVRPFSGTPSSMLKLGLVQMHVGKGKASNLERAANFVRQAAEKRTDNFPLYAEPIPDPEEVESLRWALLLTLKQTDELKRLSPSFAALSDMARTNNVFLIGGSIPEVFDLNGESMFFNSSPVFNPAGELIAKHSKVHMFDINVPGQMMFHESDTMTAGKHATTFKLREDCTVGLGICFDIRFPELAQCMAQDPDVKLLVYPGAFNLTTGPAHWELLHRARALDQQVFVASAAPARDMNGSYHVSKALPCTAEVEQSWGHSMCVDPWGVVLASADEKETLVLLDLDLERTTEVRQQINLREAKQPLVYEAGASAFGFEGFHYSGVFSSTWSEEFGSSEHESLQVAKEEVFDCEDEESENSVEDVVAVPVEETTWELSEEETKRKSRGREEAFDTSSDEEHTELTSSTETENDSEITETEDANENELEDFTELLSDQFSDLLSDQYSEPPSDERESVNEMKRM